MLNKIIKIKQAKGNEKIEALKKYDCPELRDILRYTYDPFKKYYMSAPELIGNKFGKKIDSESFGLFDDLSKRVLSGDSAFEEVCDHIVSLNFASAEVFKMILNKDLRIGINVKTIEKAFPGLLPTTNDGETKPSVMLLKNFDQKKVKWPVMAAIKKDGIRARYKNGKLYTRTGRLFVGLDHIIEELEYYPHELDGELCIPGEIFDVSSGKIRSKEQTPEAVYYIFDSPSIDGTKEKRYKDMRYYYQRTDHVEILRHEKYDGPISLYLDFEQAVASGEEGLVIYDPDSYYTNKRSYDWTRLVPLKTEDCKVIGFFEGKGKNAKSLGGVIIDYNGQKVNVGTGFKEKVLLNQSVIEIGKKDTREDHLEVGGHTPPKNCVALQNTRSFIWENQNFFLGKIIECEFKEKTKTGSMRQPRFKRWRFDK